METSITIVQSLDNTDIQKENSYPHLRNSGFVRTVKPREQWLLLVNDAWKWTQLPKNEVVRDYLVVMLDRHILRTDIVECLSAFSYYQHALQQDLISNDCLQDVADMSLLYASLYPRRSLYRHEPRSLEYTAELGVSLFRELADSEKQESCFKVPFNEMAKQFVRAMMVLRSMKLPFGKALSASHPNSFPSDKEAVQISQQFLLRLKTV